MCKCSSAIGRRVPPSHRRDCLLSVGLFYCPRTDTMSSRPTQLYCWCAPPWPYTAPPNLIALAGARPAIRAEDSVLTLTPSPTLLLSIFTFVSTALDHDSLLLTVCAVTAEWTRILPGIDIGSHLVPCITALLNVTRSASSLPVNGRQFTPPPYARCRPTPTLYDRAGRIIAIAGASMGDTRRVDHALASTVPAP